MPVLSKVRDNLPWVFVAIDAIFLALGGLSVFLLDNHSGNWGGGNGILMVLIALPGILVLKVTGILSLLSLLPPEGWTDTLRQGLVLATNLGLAYTVGWSLQVMCPKPSQ